MTADSARPYLVVSGGTQPLVLSKDAMTLGRSPENDIHLDDPEISRRHASFTRRNGATLLTDLGSSNGTFVNGSRLQGTVELRDGDQLNFAGIQVVFHAAPAAAAPLVPPPARPGHESPFPSTSTPWAPTAPTQGPAPSPRSTPPRSRPGPVVPGPPPSVQQSGPPPAPPLSPGPLPSAGRSTPGPLPPGAGSGLQPPGAVPHPPPSPGPLPPSTAPPTTQVPAAALERAGGQPVLLIRPETTLGRVQGNDVVLPDTYVSSWHAKIVNQGGQFLLIDLSSANGTYVNGQRVTQPWVLEPGDEVRFGQTEFFFRRLTPVPKKRARGGPRPPGGRPGGPGPKT